VIPLRPSDHSITEEQAHAALGERALGRDAPLELAPPAGTFKFVARTKDAVGGSVMPGEIAQAAKLMSARMAKLIGSPGCPFRHPNLLSPVQARPPCVASGKRDVFAGDSPSNVRLVGVYLGTFRGHVFTTERYAA
jgi:hypothetical protein